MRLITPTNKTFFPALVPIVPGIAIWGLQVGEDVGPDVAFWLVTGGGVLLILVSVFTGSDHSTPEVESAGRRARQVAFHARRREGRLLNHPGLVSPSTRR